MKRFVALLLALIMILSLSATAFADETGGENENPPATKNNSITINNAMPRETYLLFKLFTLEVDNEFVPAKYSYKITPEWAAFFAEGGDGAQYITVNELGYVTDITDVADLAKAAAKWTGKPNPVRGATVAEGEDSVTFSNLDNGYWLITSSLGTLAMTDTTPDKEAVVIEEKNKPNGIVKEVLEDSDNSWGEENDAQIGDTIYFRTTVTLQPGSRNVTVTDKMYGEVIGCGLDYMQDLVVKVGDKELVKGTDYVDVKDIYNTFKIQFTEAFLDSIDTTTEVVLTYSAELNTAIIVPENGQGYEGCNMEIGPQINKVVLSYGNGTTVEDETKTLTHSITVLKYDGADESENPAPLAGAEFSLMKDGQVVYLVKEEGRDDYYKVCKSNISGAQTTFITVSDKPITIFGLDTEDEYTLVEVNPPAGYNKLNAPIDVVVKEDNTTVVEVENNAGTELPSTGGVGTTLFYICGGILVLASFVLLITKKRMAEMA